MTKIFCDMCKEDVSNTSKKTAFNVNVTSFSKGLIPVKQVDMNFDLCLKCQNKLIKYLKGE